MKKNKMIIDDLDGRHEEGLGWNPDGEFCGECFHATCRGCPVLLKTNETRRKRRKING